MGIFNPELFNNLEITTANQTRMVPVAEGDAVLAVVSKVDPVRAVGDKGSIAFDVVWDVLDSEHLRQSGLEKGSVRQTVWLDITPQGTLDDGLNKNVGLGRLRDAVDLNEAGKPFSFQMLKGQTAKIKIKHRLINDEGDVQAEVKGVTHS